MTGKAYKLPFRILGIPILLDITFLIVLPLFAWIIARNLPAYMHAFGVAPDDAARFHTGWFPYLLGLIAAIGLFASVVLHELGHAIVARLFGVEVRSITLWLLGGVASFEQMPQQRGAEAVVAIVGPIVSFALAVLCWVAATLTPAEAAATRVVLYYLAVTNVLLAVFNLIPALPLDGGRVLRSLLALRLPAVRATSIAATISRVLAVVLGLIGFASFNIFLMLVAFFIYMAVNSETSQVMIAQALRGIGVRDVMMRNVVSVEPDITVSDLTARMLREHHLGFPVLSDGKLLGMVTLDHVQGASPQALVRDVMNRQLPLICESATALDAMQLMGRDGAGRLVVVDGDGRMLGLITKTDLMHVIRIRTLGVDQYAPPGGYSEPTPPPTLIRPSSPRPA